MEKGRPLPKFGEWDVNDPASADGFTVIFNKARDEKKTGRKLTSPGREELISKDVTDNNKPQSAYRRRITSDAKGDHNIQVVKLHAQFYKLG